MAPRTFQIEAEQVLPDDFIPEQPFDIGPHRSDLDQLMADAAIVLERIGGTFSISAVRRQIADANGNPTDVWVPFAYRAKWEPFAPGIRVQAPQRGETPAPAPEPEPDDQGPDPEALTEDEMEDHFPEDGSDAAAHLGLEDDDFGPDAEQALAQAGAVEQG